MSYQGGCGYSQPSMSYMSAAPQGAMYSSSYQPSADSTYMTNLTMEEPSVLYFSPAEFLDPTRPPVENITEENKGAVMSIIRETFQHRTGEDFPENKIIISIGSKETLKEWHNVAGGAWSEGIQGFALNSNNNQPHRIFVKEGPKDQMLLTLGHEIGHVMTPTLENEHDEEAKAFAFSIAWMQTIIEHDIAGLSSFLNPQPAMNGLHNVAYGFVQTLIQNGKTAMQAFVDIVNKTASCKQQPEVITI
ncbi:MAG: hypothetical protein QGG83_00735 [Candidatus Woesearchaeota archaeon]|nr:hypothetical protein [Candidatus Woesearchaeota archaeon]MDP7647291.1 hypothetical protein [Candidatus Woesearchaeota archaeon]